MGEGHSQVLVNRTLSDPLTATVTFHVLSHGPMDPSEMPDQIKIVNGGCPDFSCIVLESEIIFAPYVDLSRPEVFLVSRNRTLLGGLM